MSPLKCSSLSPVHAPRFINRVFHQANVEGAVQYQDSSYLLAKAYTYGRAGQSVYAVYQRKDLFHAPR